MATVRIALRRTGTRRDFVLSRRAKPGPNRTAFSGRVGARRLRPGTYRVTVTATDAAGNRAAARRLRLRIVR